MTRSWRKVDNFIEEPCTGLQNVPSSNAIMYPGGSGAFVSCSINALPGSTIYLLVGGGGAVGNYAQDTSNAIGGGG